LWPRVSRSRFPWRREPQVMSCGCLDVVRRRAVSEMRPASSPTLAVKDIASPKGWSQKWAHELLKAANHSEISTSKALSGLPWAQGVAGSNPVAPTTSLKNLHNTKKVRELAESSAVLAIRLASPRIAGFRIEVGTKVVTAKPHLSDANVGGCRKSAVKTGYTRRCAGARGGFRV
jgi:hypothetical protein